MKYGSVCSGIEAASVAWHPLGWEPHNEVMPIPQTEIDLSTGVLTQNEGY